MSGFKAISVTHNTADLVIREKIALGPDQIRKLGRVLKDYLDIQDLLILSTCNRTEFYYTADKNLSRQIIKIFGGFKGILVENFYLHFMFYNEKDQALRHLFRVASGLESQILGDNQIVHQIKRAYEISKEGGFCGGYLHHILSQVFTCNKRIIAHTGFRDGTSSMSYATIGLLKERGIDLKAPILVVGLGKNNIDVCKNLKSHGYTNVTIVNRTQSKARDFAHQHNFKCKKISKLEEELRQHDVVISAISKRSPLIKLKMLDLESGLCPDLMIDLSVPRSIEPEIDHIYEVDLLNVDYFSNRSQHVIETRKKHIPQVEQIVEDIVRGVEEWERVRVINPTIQEIKLALEQIASMEIARYEDEFSEYQMGVLQYVSSNIVQKILKNPVVALRNGCREGDDTEAQLAMLKELFLKPVTEEHTVTGQKAS